MKPNHSRIWGVGAALGALSIPSAFAQTAQPEKPMNVLFLISDDMRTELHAYGSLLAKTPNLDRLLSQGVQFENGYCQYPLSGPSRSSLLSGRRPTTSGLYGNREWFGATFPDWVSLPKYFKQNGYASLRTGKVFHGGIDDTAAGREGGEARRVSNPIKDPTPSSVTYEERRAHIEQMRRADAGQARGSDRWEAVTGPAVATQGDTRVGDRAIEYIQRYAQSGQPFFLACGFSKPHSPLVAPKEFFDLYDDVEIPLPVDFASLPMIPPGFPEGSIRVNQADLFINRSASAEESKDMIKAYLACVSYVDWNVGRVLAELDRQGLRENTIIVFWADHGYQLGEKGKWSKAGSLWEQGTRVPFFILDPRAKGNGTSSHRVVELIDLYPTLADLCGLPAPQGLDGVSLAPLLDDPAAEWDRPAYTVWNEHGKGVTGVAVRTEQWRYAEFFGHGAGCFLTDPVNDPAELVNLANDPAYKAVVEEMHRLAMEKVAGKVELPPPPEN